MAKTVFILGAGASQSAGAPLMGDFLDTANELWKLGKVSDSEKSFESLFAGLALLQRVHSKAQFDLKNLESVFSAFEMAKTLGSLAGVSEDEISEMLGSIRKVIVKTLEHKLLFPLEGRKILPPEPYQDFMGLILGLRRDVEPKHSVAVITFNYDLALDYAFFFSTLVPNYGLEPTNARNIPLLKLHGSLNWGHCSECGEIAPFQIEDYLRRMNRIPRPDQKFLRLDIGTNISKLNHLHSDGEKPMDSEPFIIPPTWNKGRYHDSLTSVWRSAASELSGAENIFIIGYSLPNTDEFFRHLYALGTLSDTLLRRLWVFNPEDSGQTKKRFRSLLGPGAEQRFSYNPYRFYEAIHFLKHEFALDGVRSGKFIT